jgi:hypothetical protein
VAVVLGERAVVEAVAVGDLVGTDHAGVANVDHVRVDHVECDPEPHEEDHRHHEPGDRHVRHQPLAAIARAEAGEQHAHEEVPEHRVYERHRREDLAAVEVHVRDREADEHEQVEVQQPERPARVHERRQEEQPERNPHIRRVERATERALVAARHPPRDLWPRPRLKDVAEPVAHVDLDELVPVREPAHLPAAAPARVCGRLEVGVIGALRAHLVRPLRDPDGLAGAELEALRRLRLRGRGREVGRARRRRAQQGEDER